MQELPRKASCPTEGKPCVNSRRPEKTLWIDGLPIADLHTIDAGCGDTLYMVKLYRSAPAGGVSDLIRRVQSCRPSARTGGATAATLMQALESEELQYSELSEGEEPVWSRVLMEM